MLISCHMFVVAICFSKHYDSNSQMTVVDVLLSIVMLFTISTYKQNGIREGYTVIVIISVIKPRPTVGRL